MKRSRFTETQIISILKKADASVKVKDVCRRHGISDAIYYNWKSKYGDMSASVLRPSKKHKFVSYEADEICLLPQTKGE